MLKIIEIALQEEGYLEKASNSQLYNKTANAGRNNYTKYGEWYGLNGYAWCDMFVSWCAYQAGESEAVGKYASCTAHSQFFKSKGQWFYKGAKTPREGDIIFFGETEHIGFVISCDGLYVYTIEGNTSGASGLIANGGGVCRKTYRINDSCIAGYARPNYKNQNEVKSMANQTFGIDVSSHNGSIDWSKVKNAGVKFAIIRAGYGRYAVDDYFYTNIKNALANGIAVGVYWFSYALDVNGAKEEANKCLETIKGYNVTLPVFFDFEYDTVRYAKDNGVTLGKNEFNNHTVAFCEVIKQAGYTPGVYYNYDYYKSYVDNSKIGKYAIWYAQYSSNPVVTNYTIWQYSSSGTVNGISGKVDVNYMQKAVLTPSWKKNDKGWWYDYGDGTYPTSQWLKIDGIWYYFKESGYMAEREIVEGKYYVGAEGQLAVNKVLRTNAEGRIIEAEPWYYYLKEVPKGYRKELDKLIEAGKFKGRGGSGDDLIIDGPESFVRAIIIDNR